MKLSTNKLNLYDFILYSPARVYNNINDYILLQILKNCKLSKTTPNFHQYSLFKIMCFNACIPKTHVLCTLVINVDSIQSDQFHTSSG